MDVAFSGACRTRGLRPVRLLSERKEECLRIGMGIRKLLLCAVFVALVFILTSYCYLQSFSAKTDPSVASPIHTLPLQDGPSDGLRRTRAEKFRANIKAYYSKIIPAELKARRRRGGDLGYLMTCTFSEQLESGLYDLHQLADLADSWGMKLGEPTVHKSMFKFPLSSRFPWKMGNFFDQHEVNANFRKYFKNDHSLMVDGKDILSDTELSSDVVFVHWTIAPRLSKAECFEVAISTVNACTKSMTGKIWSLDKKDLKIICLQKHKKINFRRLIYNHPVLRHVMLENRKDGSKFSIVFTSWNGIRSKPDPFFYFDPDFHQRHYGRPHSIAHSKEVLSAAKELKQVSSLGSLTLGVHVRLERLIRKKFAIPRCLEQMLQAIDSLKEAGLWDLGLAFTDYRQVGSQTCGGVQCANIAKLLEIDKKLEAHGLRVNPSLPNNGESPLQLESGFVSNVEQEVLSQLDVLVLVGLGSFQMGILDRFSRHHNISLSDALRDGPGKKPRVVRVCHERSWSSTKTTMWGHKVS